MREERDRPGTVAAALPTDYLDPVWRCKPAHGSQVFTVALDPREYEFVVARGWVTVDGVRWQVSLEGCDGRVWGDGRVMIRCQSPAEQPLVIPDKWPPLREEIAA